MRETFRIFGFSKMSGSSNLHNMKQHYKCFIFIILMQVCITQPVSAQIIYVSGYSPTQSDQLFGVYNFQTCEFCPQLAVPTEFLDGNSGSDVIALPNGNVVTMGERIYVFNPPDPNPVYTYIPSVPTVYGGATYAPNGTIYVITMESPNSTTSISIFNPVTYALTLVGSLPGTWTAFAPFFYNGQLYARAINYNGSPPYERELVTLTLTNPVVPTVVYSPIPNCGGNMDAINSGPYAGVYTAQLTTGCSSFDAFNTYDVPNNSVEPICTLPPELLLTSAGMSEIPPGFPTSGCICLTNAGNVPTPNASLCINETFTFSNNSGYLESNDLKSYILFSNPADTSGSIVAINSQPEFTFNPATMQTGVTYYACAMAGNNLNGAVNLNDPCLDFSNAAQLIWRPLPTVSFTTANPNFCSNSCKTIQATFTGTAPFTLTYSVTYDTGATETFSQTVNGTTASFDICPPAGYLGALNIQATGITDTWCTCQ